MKLIIFSILNFKKVSRFFYFTFKPRAHTSEIIRYQRQQRVKDNEKRKRKDNISTEETHCNIYIHLHTIQGHD